MFRIRQYPKILFLLALIVTTVVMFFKLSSPPHVFYKNSRLLHQRRLSNEESDKNANFVLNNLQLKNSSTLIETDKLIENLPNIYFKNGSDFWAQHNETCANFPPFIQIQFASDHWQLLRAENGTLHLLNSYLDYRKIHEDKNIVRIISMYDQFDSNDSFYCQFWFNNTKKPLIVKSEKLKWMWIKGWGGSISGLYQPYLISCLIPEEVSPMSVSVVENPCDQATNNLRVSFKEVKKEKKKDFVVCVKGLNFPEEDKSVRLLEWIEVLLTLGADKINFYKFNVHPTVQKILDFYSNSSKVEVTPLTLVGGAPNSPFLQSKYLRKLYYQQILPEVVAYNDCLYKHLQEFKFVVLLDTDEVIVPTNGNSWNGMIKQVYEEGKTSYLARNVYFLDSHLHDHEWFDGVPKFLHMMQHVYRAEMYTPLGHFVKGFHDTSRVLTLHNHFPFDCLKGCNHKDIGLEFGHLQHYRRDCYYGGPNCDLMKINSIMDPRLWNYKDVLLKNIINALVKLELVSL